MEQTAKVGGDQPELPKAVSVCIMAMVRASHGS